jgi:hypothetical protein
MKIKTKAWLVSQGILVITALLIQITFYREIQLGPLLGMTKRPYWDIIYDRPPDIPDFIREKGLPPHLWDARLPLSVTEIRAAKLAGHQRAHRREEGLRTAFQGGLLVNGLYLVIFQALWWYIPRQVRPKEKRALNH